MSEMTLITPTPEEQLLDAGEARGLIVRLHRLSWFRVDVVAVIEQEGAVCVVRREIHVGTHISSRTGEPVPLKAAEAFACRPCFLGKLARQLARLGLGWDKHFEARTGLDGESLACRYRDPLGGFRVVHLFCWNESPHRKVRRLGDFLNRLALSPIQTLQRRALFSRFW